MLMMTITPVMETAIGGITMNSFFVCGTVATAILIIFLIMKELFDTSDKRHHRYAVQALDTMILPFFAVFAVMVAYKVLQVISP